MGWQAYRQGMHEEHRQQRLQRRQSHQRFRQLTLSPMGLLLFIGGQSLVLRDRLSGAGQCVCEQLERWVFALWILCGLGQWRATPGSARRQAWRRRGQMGCVLLGIGFCMGFSQWVLSTTITARMWSGSPWALVQIDRLPNESLLFEKDGDRAKEPKTKEGKAPAAAPFVLGLPGPSASSFWINQPQWEALSQAAAQRGMEWPSWTACQAQGVCAAHALTLTEAWGWLVGHPPVWAKGTPTLGAPWSNRRVTIPDGDCAFFGWLVAIVGSLLLFAGVSKLRKLYDESPLVALTLMHERWSRPLGFGLRGLGLSLSLLWLESERNATWSTLDVCCVAFTLIEACVIICVIDVTCGLLVAPSVQSGLGKAYTTTAQRVLRMGEPLQERFELGLALRKPGRGRGAAHSGTLSVSGPQSHEPGEGTIPRPARARRL